MENGILLVHLPIDRETPVKDNSDDDDAVKIDL